MDAPAFDKRKDDAWQAGVDKSLGDIKARLDSGDEEFKATRAELAENTKITTEVRDLLNALDWLRKFARFMTPFIVIGTALIGLWQALKGIGR